MYQDVQFGTKSEREENTLCNYRLETKHRGMNTFFHNKNYGLPWLLQPLAYSPLGEDFFHPFLSSCEHGALSAYLILFFLFSFLASNRLPFLLFYPVICFLV